MARLKTCKQCRIRFVPDRPMQVCCSPLCAIDYGRKQSAIKAARKALAERRAARLKREVMKTRTEWMKDAQRAFNAYIRERDKDKPCICCGLPLGNGDVGGSFDCGHYRSVGSAPHLRFDERNAHAQRKQCNRYGAGRAVDYRIGLIGRIGSERVEILEADNEPRKYSIEELKTIISTYKQKARELKNENRN